MDQEEKRQVPSFLKKILDLDVYLTKVFVNTFEKYVLIKQLQTHYKALEISCHGIPWIALTLASIWIFHLTSLYQLQVNLFIGFLIDILLVTILKALTRRRRPAVNDDPFSIGPDKYSFPSGHASRCTFIVYYFLYLWPISVIFAPSLLVWCTCVCLSRLLMRRHNILDVLVGIVLGILEGMFIGYLYLSQDTCINLVTWITNEKIDDV
ncbi:phospholipid phosphatase 6 [Vespula pensylvanica]|uniref:Phosphatidic acid phosphatase type 2/haloperoxidase domain-containing protein n=1 Tax=Vespula pensylvanica TaxID=30213 RepID=A0A834MWA5_VESPE|nr:phospholipid phosphatase 6 [Vespula pensylvanica]XP_043685346.1 phospholipid phosphatase 6 [Vespula pensylvanica]KAF7387602.1 hypothetical protein H0235_018324 [Vespula pensylvanica]